jgi:hypothetical protein
MMYIRCGRPGPQGEIPDLLVRHKSRLDTARHLLRKMMVEGVGIMVACFLHEGVVGWRAE